MLRRQETYRLQVLRGIFLIAGTLLLFNRLSPTFYVNTSFSIFRSAHHSAINTGNPKSSVGLANHHESPVSTPDKRYDFDGNCVVVSSDWSLVLHVPDIPKRCPALRQKLAFPHLSSQSLRGPPRLFS